MIELLSLEFNQHMAFQNSVIEHKIDTFIRIINKNLLLASLKAHAGPHLKDELLKMANNTILQILFFPHILWLEIQELQHVLGLDKSCHVQFLRLDVRYLGKLVRILAPAATHIIQAPYLTLQFANTPSTPNRLECVKCPLQIVIKPNQLTNM